jgi:hypothetical protein
MNADPLKAKAENLGEARAARICDRLMALDCPEGVRLERSDDGVCLIGKGLRRMMLTDPKLRNFGR